MKSTNVVIGIMLLLILMGCSQEAQVVKDICEAPMIEVAGECCLDKNKNSVCDDLEVEEKDDEEVKQEIKEAKKEVEKDYFNVSELEDAINKTFFPLKRYSFEDGEKANLSGLENKYDLRSSERFNILKMKNKVNYMNNDKDFSDFINKKYELRVKNWKISANWEIDYQRAQSPSWNFVEFDYNHSLDEIDIAGNNVFVERHDLFFEQEDDIMAPFWDYYKFHVLCTPQIILEVEPSERWWFIYYKGDSVSVKKRFLDSELKEQKKEMVEITKMMMDVCNGIVKKPELKPNEVIFYGKDGFLPSEANMKKGQKFIVHNENENDDGIILTFIRDKPKKVFNSKVIDIGEAGEILIEDEGNYTFFELQYAPRGKLVVE